MLVPGRELPAGHQHSGGGAAVAAGAGWRVYLNWKSAVWVVPSVSVRVNCWQVPE